ncbi:hypothetical protein [Phycicoccus sonneratiae]|uniref:Transglycosylase SLT domain-containing protein n=1 Tax=Phycicoccus sonneratiae TaxID=2807628 RepID=A0ABS2CPX1_9MICO|nr:hypothetical protein [Phycicoccus sonneraticus]MBM6401945.1 hypothetical protein [Phycicoccus sonneraticus]
MILGADTDEMRDVQKDCLEAAKVADQVVIFLTALVIVLKAASFWTGGSSAAYAAYLEGTVIPWLKKISMALKMFAQVLGANAQAQDEVSSGKDVDLSTLPRYTSPQLPQTSCTDCPPAMTFPGTATTGGSTVPTGGSTPDGSSTSTTPGSTYDGSSTTTAVGSTGATGATPTTGGTFTGGGAGGALGTGSGGGGGTTGGSTGTGGSTLDPGSGAGSALGAGTDTAAGTAGTAGGSATDTSSYDGGQVGAGSALGTGDAAPVTTSTGDGSSTGTYAAAGTAGALGVGGAAALAGRGTGQGAGLTSPDGFDYSRIKGVAGNERVTPEFLRRTEQIATKLGCKPEDLMAVMSFETGGSFDPAQRNMAGGSARGLIQFMPDTARGLGTTSEALTRMTPVQQLDYVEKYFGNGRYTTVEGLYSKVLAGHAVNDPDAVLFREGTRAYRANRGVDIDGVGGITAGEAAAKVRARILPVR